MEQPSAPPPRARSREARAVGLIAIVVLLSAMTAALVARSDRVHDPDPGSPEAAVKVYVEAVLDGDADAARAVFATEEQGGVVPDHCFDDPFGFAPVFGPMFGDEAVRVSVRETDIDGDNARVRLDVEIGGGLFDDGWDSETTIDLVAVAAADWRIVEVFGVLATCL